MTPPQHRRSRPDDFRPDDPGPRRPRHARSPRTRRTATVWWTPEPDHPTPVTPGPGWLHQTLANIATTYTRSDDRVLVISPHPAPPGADELHQEAGTVPGLHRAVRMWILDPDNAAGAAADAPSVPVPESVPGLRPVRRPTGPSPGPDSVVGPDPARFPTGPDRFDVVIAAVDPHRTAWFVSVSWAHLLAQPGLLVLITHSDRTGLPPDPLGRLIAELRSTGLAYHERLIAVSGPVSTSATKRDRGGDESTLNVRAELLLFATATWRRGDVPAARWRDVT
ncbi:hypothetical protein [Yinghuangia sp. YIM S10712]|uniref:hypothetical protein n=1 Tax=Yinghuangia sp. YIM S10712 TaxID=3436930 RepID=UPI003F538207